MSQAAPMLSYGRPVTAVRRRRHWVWHVLAIPTLIIPFLNFACDQTPVGTIWKSIQGGLPQRSDITDTLGGCSLAVGLCFGAIACFWRLRILWRPSTSAIRGVFIGVAVAGWACTVTVLVLTFPTIASEPVLTWAYCTCGLAFAGSIVLLLVPRRSNGTDVAILIALLSPFVSCGGYALYLAGPDRQIGWYFTMCSVPISAAECLLLVVLPDAPMQIETAGLEPAVVISSG